MSRSDKRRDMSDEVRIRLLESDMDDMEEAAHRLELAIDGVRKVLVGILISVTTASVLLALNLMIGVPA